MKQDEWLTCLLRATRVDEERKPERPELDVYGSEHGKNAVICLQISMSVSKTTHLRGATGQLLRLAEKQPVLRARDVAHQGIHIAH
jgi:hypothetical protein